MRSSRVSLNDGGCVQIALFVKPGRIEAMTPAKDAESVTNDSASVGCRVASHFVYQGGKLGTMPRRDD
jgi:hypothetical protein